MSHFDVGLNPNFRCSDDIVPTKLIQTTYHYGTVGACKNIYDLAAAGIAMGYFNNTLKLVVAFIPSSGLNVDTKLRNFFIGRKFKNIFNPIEKKPLPPAFIVDWRHVNMKQMGVQRNFNERVAVHPRMLG